MWARIICRRHYCKHSVMANRRTKDHRHDWCQHSKYQNRILNISTCLPSCGQFPYSIYVCRFMRWAPKCQNGLSMHWTYCAVPIGSQTVSNRRNKSNCFHDCSEWLFLPFLTVSSWSTMFAVSLLTIQCARRFYETQYVQVFSRQSKINITHYIVGYFHYFGAFLTIISQAPGFNRNPQPGDEPYLHTDQLYPFHLSMTLLFLFAWYQQCRANVMLANLRKNHKGTSAPYCQQKLEMANRNH